MREGKGKVLTHDFKITIRASRGCSGRVQASGGSCRRTLELQHSNQHSRRRCRWPRSYRPTLCVSLGGVGEELGPVGSTAHVNGLSEEVTDQIALYLNFDMIGSPNFVCFIYDGDDSDGVGAGPEGSAQIEAFFEGFYENRDRPYLGTDFSGRSGYGPFIAVGIPAGGLFTGAEGSRQQRRPASGAVPPAISTTRATTWRVTRSTTSASTRSLPTLMRWRHRCSTLG